MAATSAETSYTDVDIVVVGGGIQGLVVLRELSSAGYDCVLVTRDAVGTGQTLHSHGALISGVGLATGALSRVVDDVAAPYLQDLGVDMQRDAPALLVAPQAVVTQLSPTWDSTGYRPQRTDPTIVPGLVTSDPVYRVPGCNVDMQAVVRALVQGVEPRILHGEVTAADPDVRVRTVDGATHVLHARGVVVAAGCGTKRLLLDVFGVEGALPARVSYAALHMVVLRAPPGLLPALGAIVSPDLLVIGHAIGTGAGAGPVTTWYATPNDPDAQPYADAPAEARAPVEPALVAQGVEGLRRLFPILEHDDDRVQATVFAGYKQQLDGSPTARACELVDADNNLIVCLPSILANAIPNAADVLRMLRDLVEPSYAATPIPSAGGALLGQAEEDRCDWQPWRSFVRAHAG